MLDHDKEMNFKFKKSRKFYKFHVLKCNNDLEFVSKLKICCQENLDNFFEFL